MRLAIERERAEGAWRASKDRLQSALDAAKLGSWQYDPPRRVFSWDARSKEIFGVPEDGATVEEFMKWVWCIQTMWTRFRWPSTERSIPPNRSDPRHSSGSGEETVKFDGWRPRGLLVLRARGTIATGGELHRHRPGHH
jgi:PAS domain-containing protein